MQAPKTAELAPKTKVVRHVPFPRPQSDQDVEQIIERDFVSVGHKPGVQNWRALSAFGEFIQAANAISKIADATDRQSENIVLLQELAREIVQSLAYSFSGKPAEVLVALAENVIHQLDLCSNDELQAVSKKRLTWPSLIALKELKKTQPGKGQNAQFTKRHRLEVLQLGTEAPTKILGLGEPNRLAQGMIDTILANQQLLSRLETARQCDPVGFNERLVESFPKWVHECGKLKPLDQSSAKTWFDVGWDALLEATNYKPEECSDLFEMGFYRAKKGDGLYANKKLSAIKKGSPNAEKDVPLNRKNLSGTEKANVRDGIKTKIRHAFVRLVRKTESIEMIDLGSSAPPDAVKQTGG